MRLDFIKQLIERKLTQAQVASNLGLSITPTMFKDGLCPVDCVNFHKL